MNRFDTSQIKVGMRFSKPVFFDDGFNMFIESGITVKPYHLVAITRWHVPYLLTDGRPLGENEDFVEEEVIEEIEALDEVTESESASDFDTVWENIEELN